MSLQTNGRVTPEGRAAAQEAAEARAPIAVLLLSNTQAAAVLSGRGGQVDVLQRANISHRARRQGNSVTIALAGGDDATVDEALGHIRQAGRLGPNAPILLIRPNLDPKSPIVGLRLDHPEQK